MTETKITGAVEKNDPSKLKDDEKRLLKSLFMEYRNMLFDYYDRHPSKDDQSAAEKNGE